MPENPPFSTCLPVRRWRSTSEIPGTTTDVVEKTMELLPLGPVTLIDTAGLDDTSALGPARLEMTKKALQRADVLAIVVTPSGWSDTEEALLREAYAAKIPVLVVINKTDIGPPKPNFLALLELKRLAWISGSATAAPALQEDSASRLKKRCGGCCRNCSPRHRRCWAICCRRPVWPCWWCRSIWAPQPGA